MSERGAVIRRLLWRRGRRVPGPPPAALTTAIGVAVAACGLAVVDLTPAWAATLIVTAAAALIWWCTTPLTEDLPRLARIGDMPVILVLAWSGWLAVPWGAGGAAQARTVAAEPAAPHHDVAPLHTGRLHAPQAVLNERRRLAAEVHDAAGHGLATIAMQAGVALLLFDEQPEQARESLRAIQATSTRALAELRAALDRMHPLETAPPSVRDLRPLVEGVRAAGLPVELHIGEPGPAIPAHIDAAVYRVVRESLTNVLRHAGPTTAVVRVAHAPPHLVVEVTDRGRATPAAPHTEGRGLTGMRARVEAAGGTFTASPREGGGFRVLARFPVPPTA
ncbi:signal transduction histidine kinase [Thermocatellispora tengchongensis]|uniref:histidine kinase n=1 Tax=Thermocatellispora tengchongensis TaxID=1073253 RepID=A0A840PSG2_9ACTN|nr:sensor histidine kinase [Thermocatellispora tengchongensis]MBB5140067.1 signal transduction histidine kinase [Thermocatellispora tengchongensis]